ncbi:MAG: T9SS C-terminal target domain-containing protein, partial [Chitinophagia bacterium]|nr:T9SS C-terminal target domain-containing protein [Chitinophagia bacterium]
MIDDMLIIYIYDDGLKEVALNSKLISIYPNPCRQELHLQPVSVNDIEHAHLSLYNLQGKLVYTAPYSGQANTVMLPP